MNWLRKWLHGSDGLRDLCVKRDRAVEECSAASERATGAALNNLEQSAKTYDAVASLLKHMEERGAVHDR